MENMDPTFEHNDTNPEPQPVPPVQEAPAAEQPTVAEEAPEAAAPAQAMPQYVVYGQVPNTQTQQPVYQQAPPSGWAYPPVYWQPVIPGKTPKPPKPKGESGKVAKKVFSGLAITLIAVALIAASCFVTNLLIADHWEDKVESLSEEYEERYELLGEAAQNRIDVLQGKIDDMESSLGQTGTGNGSEEPAQSQLLLAEVYERNVQAVVFINSEGVATNFFGQSQTSSLGTGFIISKDGYVVTNYHVVEGGTTIYVTTHDGMEHEAQLIGFDANNDLAVLKVEAEDLPCVSFGSSNALKVGDRVAAIGNPLGELTSTMTVGYVSAKDRVVTTDGSSINMIQTDAAINSGNSGGPLFNMDGQVVGITTAKYSGTSSSGATIEGIGFAIPIDDVMTIITDLRDYGKVKGAYLGVYIREIDSDVAKMYNLPMGVYVDSTMDGFCAQAAGIESQDIIIDLGGYEVTNISELTRALRKFEPGQTTTITVFRGGAKVHLQITLDERPDETP